jgi:hypothetical protein
MNGYTQQTILGQLRGLKFGTLAAEQITMDLVELGVATKSNYSSGMIASIIYWGLYNNAFVKRVELDVTFEQVSDWLDENWTNKEIEPVLTDIVKCYEDSKQAQIMLERLKDGAEDLKKKSLTSAPVPDGNA